MPDTFDVDHAFDALAHDVMHRASPPTAVTAIKQARHRRRTALATAAATALVVVAGFVVPTMLDGGDSSRVAEHDDLGRVRPLPAPAEFAPEGWEPLITGDTLFPHTSTCLRSFLEPVPLSRMDGYALSELGRGDDRLVSWFIEFEDAEDSADQLVSATSSLTGCGASTPVRQYPDADVRHFASSEDGIATDLWVAQIASDGPGLIGPQHRVGISLAVSKTAATSEEVATIADSLLASLRGDELWTGGAPRRTYKQALRAFDAESERLLEDVETAFGAWFAGWRESDGAPAGLPCGALPIQGYPNPFLEGSHGASDGGVGIEFHVWRTDEESAEARAAFLSELAECTLVPWEVVSSGPTTWVATSRVGTVWIVQDAEALGVLSARDAIDPPDGVSGDVFDMLASALDDRPRP